MLVQISIKNFKTFKEEAILSLVASNYTKEHAEENVFYATSSKIPLLKSAVIYGANASGKSKLIEAIVFFKDFIKKSSKESQAAEPIRIASHRLNTTTENAPSLFEFIFVENNELYRYGFEVDQTKVHAEWLYHKPKTKEVEIFYREAQEFELHSTRFRIGKKLVGDQMIRENALLLSVAAQFNDPLAIHILEWLNHFNIISGIQEEGYEELTVKQLDDPTKKDKILKFIQFADLGIEDLMLKEIDVADLPKDFPNDLKELLLKKQFTEIFSGIRTLHRKYDEKNLPLREMESFSMSQDESSGTQKYFALSGIILDALESGGMLVIDELDAKLHPILVHNIVAL
ncbi:MAG TPA: ATP-binding protein, partial [Flavisolibacter sp.]|nr:ATP-binding protein [Flavisolibacter sp.]